jgi:hypothetical protein
MAVYNSVPPLREAKFCGVPSCVFDKLGCAAGERRLRNTAVETRKLKFGTLICTISVRRPNANLFTWVHGYTCDSILIFRMSRNFMSTPQDLIPKVILNQKCHMNIGSILSCYGATGIGNSSFMLPAASKIRWCSFSFLFTLRSYTML